LAFGKELWTTKTLTEVVNTVIYHFHVKPNQAEYPVNFA